MKKESDIEGYVLTRVIAIILGGFGLFFFTIGTADPKFAEMEVVKGIGIFLFLMGIGCGIASLLTKIEK